MNGILLVDKPKQWTSFDVVAIVRGIIRRQTGIKKPKVGHSGTLDPLATGLLLLLVGDYCKRASEFSGLDKTYEATVTLGYTSTTGDEEGEKKQVSMQQPSIDDVKAASQSFIGTYEQTPPAFSAKKVGGKRAYNLARRGEPVALQPKPVTIHSLLIKKYEYPILFLRTTVSSGTYIRSLAEDIGTSLKTGAYLSDLRRTDIGNYSINDASSIDDIDVNLQLRHTTLDK